MKIEATNVYVMLTIFFATLPRMTYFLVTNKRRYPEILFKGKYLIFLIMSVICVIASLILSLLFSNDFFYVGIFLSWAVITGILLCLYFVLWVIFWMHGYDGQYQFNKIIVPAPMCTLSFSIIFLSGLATLNYYVIGLSVLYCVFAYLWNYKGYKETKPSVLDDQPIREPEE